MSSEKKRLLILLGPTAVGKSASAIEIAKAVDAEIINCDSMQVYRGFDIGTDTISRDRMEDIPHHLLNIIEPDTQFTAADFVRHAVGAITAIHEAGKLPIITGGTGLYLQALIEGLFPDGGKDPDVRRSLEKERESLGLEALWQQLSEVDPVYARKIGPRDGVRIIRALEIYRTTGIPFSRHLPKTRSAVKNFNVLQIGLRMDRNLLYTRIEHRVDRMFSEGIVEETKALLDRGVPPESPPFRALGYKHVVAFLEGKINEEEAIELTKRDTRRYSKRQMTWFRKKKDILWFDAQDIPAVITAVCEHFGLKDKRVSSVLGKGID